MAWPLLCTYLRGGPRNWNPYNLIRMQPRQKRVHSYTKVVRELPPWASSLLLKSNYSKMIS